MTSNTNVNTSSENLGADLNNKTENGVTNCGDWEYGDDCEHDLKEYGIYGLIFVGMVIFIYVLYVFSKGGLGEHKKKKRKKNEDSEAGGKSSSENSSSGSETNKTKPTNTTHPAQSHPPSHPVSNEVLPNEVSFTTITTPPGQADGHQPEESAEQSGARKKLKIEDGSAYDVTGARLSIWMYGLKPHSHLKGRKASRMY